MDKTVIHLISSWKHCSQILTGFIGLANNYNIQLDVKKNNEIKQHTHNLAAVLVEFRGKLIAYDLMDGYQDISGMRYLLEMVDFYFKRSFSSSVNRASLDKSHLVKIRPLGMNYLVTCKGNPYNRDDFKGLLRRFRGDKPDSYFTPDKFEMIPTKKTKGIKIMFLTRLWDHSIENAEYLNTQRIDIIRRLKKEYGNRFIGGIRASKLATELAPDLILSKQLTEKSNYLKILHEVDICISTLGLHNSIGWKMAEYVAASKAIVSDELFYEVPGPFRNGENYLSFTDGDHCCQMVERLLSDVDFMYEMQVKNCCYYNKWLHPNVLVKNTLDLVSGMI